MKVYIVPLNSSDPIYPTKECLELKILFYKEEKEFGWEITMYSKTGTEVIVTPNGQYSIRVSSY